MTTWTFRLLPIVMLSLSVPASLAAQQAFDKRFSAPPGGQLTLATDVGSVVITGRDTREVVIHVEMSDSDHLRIDAEQNSAGISVTGHVTQHIPFDWFGNSANHVRFTIDVPRDYAVHLHTSGGSLDLRNLAAAVEGRTDGGSISAERIGGPTKLETSGGSIDINDATGDVDAHTAGGSINLKSIDGRVKADTSGGSVHAEVRTNRGVYLTTSGGTITLLLPANVRASIDALTSGGRAQSELPLSSTELAERSHLRGAFNGGGEPIVVRTSGGNINVEPLR